MNEVRSFLKFIFVVNKIYQHCCEIFTSNLISICVSCIMLRQLLLIYIRTLWLLVLSVSIDSAGVMFLWFVRY